MNERDNIILNRLYRGTQSITDFCWDNITTVPLLSLINRDEIEGIRKIITTPRYSGNNRLKMQAIDEIMNFRGFRRFAGGTNRLVFDHQNAPNAVFKVAIDNVGITDNPCEYYNQRFLKPYCTKIFECSPCGTIASVEKVDRITNFDEFLSIADDYFYLMSRMVFGRKLVMDDIGIDYFMNIGIRRGNSVASGPVILDFPYLFEADGKKLICNTRLDNGTVCHGEIDIHPSFNYLVCSKCGTRYRARDLAKSPEASNILIKDEGAVRMRFRIVKNGKVDQVIDTYKVSDHFEKEYKEELTSTGTDEIKVICKRVPIEVENTEKKESSVDTKVSTKTEVKTVVNDPIPVNDTPVKNRIVKVSLNNNDSTVIDNVTVHTETDDSIKVNCVRKPIYNNKNGNTQKRVYQKAEEKSIPQINPILDKSEAKSNDSDKNLETETLDEDAIPVTEEENDNDLVDPVIDRCVDIIVNNVFSSLSSDGSSGNKVDEVISREIKEVESYQTSVANSSVNKNKTSISDNVINEMMNKFDSNLVLFDDKKSDDEDYKTVYSEEVSNNIKLEEISNKNTVSEESLSESPDELDEEIDEICALGDDNIGLSEEVKVDPELAAIEALMSSARKKSLDNIGV